MTPMPRVLRMSYLAASVAGVGFFVLSVAWLGVWPARRLVEDAARTGPEHAVPLTASEARGRAIYAREGCAYCHTQQIRFTQADITRFGAPTLAWETRADTPHMLGTRRIGPDLSRTSGTRSEDWHLTHLYAPRSVVASSVMPSYRHLFEAGPAQPRQSARDLVAYLESLGRARELAGSEGESRAASHSHMDGLTPPAALNAHPASARRTGSVPGLPAGDRDRGLALYAQHCAACHGPAREGDGPGAAGLRPKPTNLAEHDYTTQRLAQALWNGVAGTAMPAWRDLPPDDLGSLVAYLADPRPLGPQRHDNLLPEVELLELGKRVYDNNCAQCHGPTGAGDGFAAASLAIAPTNFRQQRLWEVRRGVIPRAISDGIDGTMMASWRTRLTLEEMAAVAEYVFQFFRDEYLSKEREGRR